MELKELIKQQKIKDVLVKALAYPSLAIMVQGCGMDSVLYDCEHGALSHEWLHDLMTLDNIRELLPIAGVAQLTRSDISRILDCGACGVTVPMTKTAKRAGQLVWRSKYPPLRKRSHSGGADTHYASGGSHALHMKQLNEKTMSIVQIETQQGAENIDAILNVGGTDGVLTDPCDLMISLGWPDDLMCEEELNMIQKVADACLKRDLGFGTISGIATQEYFRKESSLLISAIDTALTWGGLKQAMRGYGQLERK